MRRGWPSVCRSPMANRTHKRKLITQQLANRTHKRNVYLSNVHWSPMASFQVQSAVANDPISNGATELSKVPQSALAAGAKSYPWLLDITGDTPVMFAASLPTDTGVQRATKCIKVPSCPKCRKAHLLHGAKSYPWLLDITGDTPVMFATTWRKSAAAWHNNVPQVGTPHKTVNTGNCTADHLSNTHFCAQAAKPIKRPRKN
jgi:hypothetical protein